MAVALTELERAYLKNQPLGRLATVDPSGAPQNNPVGFMSREVIRITPTWVMSWGLDPDSPGRNIRRA